jgi:hypothetical protein
LKWPSRLSLKMGLTGCSLSKTRSTIADVIRSWRWLPDIDGP